METMTLMPLAVAATSRRRAASYVRLPETFGALPSMDMAAFASHGCWSHTTDATAIRQANTKALKAFGTRRLGETST
jgi:hypothetical protein